VASRIRILARHQSGSANSPYVYSAEVVDDEDPNAMPLWVCPHDHDSAGVAHQCAAAWRDRLTATLNVSTRRYPESA